MLTGQIAEGDQDEDGGEDHEDEVQLDALRFRQRQRVVPRDQPRACGTPHRAQAKRASQQMGSPLSVSVRWFEALEPNQAHSSCQLVSCGIVLMALQLFWRPFRYVMRLTRTAQTAPARGSVPLATPASAPWRSDSSAGSAWNEDPLCISVTAGDAMRCAKPSATLRGPSASFSIGPRPRCGQTRRNDVKPLAGLTARIPWAWLLYTTQVYTPRGFQYLPVLTARCQMFHR